MIPVSDGPREVRCSSPVIILGGDPPAAGPLHRDGRDHAVVILHHVSLAARDGVHFVLPYSELDGSRTALGTRLVIELVTSYDTGLADTSAFFVGEGGGGFHGGLNKQNITQAECGDHFMCELWDIETK